jgi:thiamine biosynthesis lipoprotein
MADPLTNGLFRLKFQALGTVCEIQFRTESVAGAKEFRKVALDWLRDFENRWSRFKPESFLSRINANAGREPIDYDENDAEIFQLCDHVHRVSRGLNDPTSLPLTLLWDKAGREDRMPSDDDIESIRQLVSWPEFEWKDGRVFLPERGMALEIGGFGKEYAVDRLVALARQCDIRDGLVDLGRDVAAFGRPPDGDAWVVGVEEARREDKALHRLALDDHGMTTSGNGRRYRTIEGRRFGHIIDPRSGWPVKNEVLTVTCLANDCLTAGQVSTTSCILGMKDGLEFVETIHGVEAIIQGAGEDRHSSRFFQHVLPQ